jgi:putative endonuclease
LLVILSGAYFSGAEGPAFVLPVTRYCLAVYACAMDERVYFAYIVASRSRTLYIGMTGDLRVRVYQHKQKLRPDGFGATYNCDRLVWFERFMGPSNAIDREKQLKGWRRSKKIVLIESKNPTWEDLSESWYPKEQLNL